jgi:hypothetical protein
MTVPAKGPKKTRVLVYLSMRLEAVFIVEEVAKPVVTEA